MVQINGMLTLTPPPQVVALHHCLNVHGSLVLFISRGSFHTVHISTLLSEVQIHYFTSAVPFDTQTGHNKINAPVTPSPCPFPWSTTMWMHPTVALPADAPFKPNSRPPPSALDVQGTDPHMTLMILLPSVAQLPGPFDSA